MCEWSQKEKSSVLTPDGMKEIWIDSCLKPIIEGLGKAGIATVGCCCGHGRENPTILLADGRVIYILDQKPWEGCGLVCWAVKWAWREFKHNLKTRLLRMTIV